MRKERWYQDTERVVRQYFLVKDRIVGLRKKESAILAGIKVIELEISEIQGVPKITAKYGAFPGGTSTQDNDYSQLMVEYNEQVIRLQQKLLRKYRQLHTLRARIADIEEWVSPIENIMDKLTSDEYQVLELRHLYRRNNCTIANIVHCTESGVRYRLRNAISTVAEKLGKRGGTILQDTITAMM